jgi:hypothetical protein
MHNIKTFFLTQAFFLTALIISGCNDGGSNSSNTPAAPTADYKISTSNAKPITATALASVAAVKGLPIQSGTLSRGAGKATSGEFDYSDFITDQLALIQVQSQLLGRGIPSVAKVSTGKALDCYVHITGDIADESNLTVGDTLTFTFDSCTYDTDVIVNGTIGITLTQISEDFTGKPPYELGIDTVFTDFTVDDHGSVYTSNGDLSMLITENASGDTTKQVNGTSLSIFFGSSTKNNTLTLTDYLIDLTEYSSGDYSVSQQGTIELAIPFISIGATFTTITPFTGNHNTGSGDPTAGELHLIGAAGSQAWIIAQPDGVNVQIDIDIDGDDTVDATVMTTWAELKDTF